VTTIGSRPTDEDVAVLLERFDANALRELAAIKEARSSQTEPTWEDEERRITEMARACRIVRAMIVEDGFPVQLAIYAVDDAFPGHRVAVIQAATEAVDEVMST
jgi:hypothetical protein